MVINNDIFESYLNCGYKAYLKLNGNSGNKSEYEIIQNELRAQYKRGALKYVLSAYKEKEILSNPASNGVIEEGKKIIANACISYNGLQSYCDFMERILGESSLGAFHYVPILVVEKEKLSQEDKLMLAYNCLVVGNMQNRQLAYGKIVYGKQFKIIKMKLNGKLNIVTKLIDDLKGSCDNGRYPQLILNRHCQICEFKDSCRAKAIEKDDLSMLSGISIKETEKQNKKGIFTVTQYSYCFQPRRKFRKSYPFELKALAIRENKIYVYGKPEEIPGADVKIYLDVEYDPDRNFNYLAGLVVSTGKSKKTYSFWADTEEEESKLYLNLLRTMEQYKNFRLYHYGSYEAQFLRKIKERISRRNSSVINAIIENSINILSIIYAHIFFPTYSNGLKDIAGYLGYKWTDELASGIQSLIWRKQFEWSNDLRSKDKLIQYNIEDCMALKRTTEFVATLIANLKKNLQDANVANADTIKAERPKRWGKINFVLKDLKYINNCAYFDYQR